MTSRWRTNKKARRWMKWQEWEPRVIALGALIIISLVVWAFIVLIEKIWVIF